jgi:hypothetical protein
VRLSRTFAITVALLAAAVVVPGARADGGPSPGVSADGKSGVTNSRTGVAYTALDGTTDTFVVSRDRRGHEVRSAVVHGSWGIPFVTWSLDIGGLSHDGTILILASPPLPVLARRSRLLVLDTATLNPRRRIVLKGDFSFDALSPDDRTLFLIQHTTPQALQRYRLRAYDLDRNTLEPHAIVDKAEPSMAGIPLRRFVGAGARWVYTLYFHDGEYFVHALDTVDARARCLDLAWHGSPNLIANVALRGKRLVVVERDGRVLTSLRVPTERRSAGWGVHGWTSAVAFAALVAAALLFGLRRRAQSPQRGP